MKQDTYLIYELVKFGLSETQAKIYLFLIRHKELRIQELSKLSGIPRSSVYESLKQLFELGIAEEVIGESYKIIKPYPIGVMHHGLDEKVVEIKRLKSDLDRLESELQVIPVENSGTSTIKYYKNRSGARQLYWNSLKAKSEVYVFSDWGRGRYVGMKFYERFVEESRARKIKEKVIINMTPHALASIRKYTFPGSPISRTKLEDIRVLSKDQIDIKGDTLIYDDTYSIVYLKEVEINGFEIESRQFVETQRSIFETLWSIAKPAKDLI